MGDFVFESTHCAFAGFITRVLKPARKRSDYSAQVVDCNAVDADLIEVQLGMSQSDVATKLIADCACAVWAGGLFDCFRGSVGSGSERRVLTTSLRSCRPVAVKM